MRYIYINKHKDMTNVTDFISRFADIETVQDVRDMIKNIYTNLQLNFHPDTPFEDYINSSGLPCFTLHQSEILDSILSKAFDICDVASVDIYEIGLTIQKELSGQNN
jgi:hypothetical protein